MKKSELRQIIREEIQKLRESNFTINDLEKHWNTNYKDIKDNMKTYGYKTYRDVGKINNPNDLSSLLDLDSKIFNGWDRNSVREFSNYLADLIKQGV